MPTPRNSSRLGTRTRPASSDASRPAARRAPATRISWPSCTGPKVRCSAMRASVEAWSELAEARLQEAGFRRGGARAAVIGLLDHQSCALSAYEIEAKLREGGRRVGRASVYRVLDQLDGLGLVTKIEVGQGIARYEPNRPGDDHHHHMVCARCGEVIPFADAELEATIDRVAERVTFEVSEHEIVLHGARADCPPAARRSEGPGDRRPDQGDDERHRHHPEPEPPVVPEPIA